MQVLFKADLEHGFEFRVHVRHYFAPCVAHVVFSKLLPLSFFTTIMVIIRIIMIARIIITTIRRIMQW